jgi:hypothetical protein
VGCVEREECRPAAGSDHERGPAVLALDVRVQPPLRHCCVRVGRVGLRV